MKQHGQHWSSSWSSNGELSSHVEPAIVNWAFSAISHLLFFSKNLFLEQAQLALKNPKPNFLFSNNFASQTQNKVLLQTGGQPYLQWAQQDEAFTGFYKLDMLLNWEISKKTSFVSFISIFKLYCLNITEVNVIWRGGSIYVGEVLLF